MKWIDSTLRRIFIGRCPICNKVLNWEGFCDSEDWWRDLIDGLPK